MATIIPERRMDSQGVPMNAVRAIHLATALVTALLSAGSGAEDATRAGTAGQAPVLCSAERALVYVRAADEATAGQHWMAAWTAYGKAEAALRELMARCPQPLAGRAEALLASLPEDKAKVDAIIQRTVCPQSMQRAATLGSQLETLQGENKDWAAVGRLAGEVESAWGEAMSICQGNNRTSAEKNKTDAALLRIRAASQLVEKACDPAFAEAERLEDLAHSAWMEHRWEDARASYEKSLPAWNKAAANCSGARLGHAKRMQENTQSRMTAKSNEIGSGLLAASLPAADAQEITRKVGDTTFSGRFQLDASKTTLSGQGRVSWDNGNVFVGTLVQGKAEGRGSMTWHNGNRYEGEWRNDLPHGKGNMSYANGDKYEGAYALGTPTGKGRYSFGSSGDRYEGEVSTGSPDGWGTYTWKSGDRFEGNWKNGLKTGAGRYTWASGQSEEGQYLNDEKLPAPPRN